MVILSKKQIKAYKNGEKTVEELANELLNTYPATIVAIEYVQLVLGNEDETSVTAPAKIPVTEAELQQIVDLFRIKQTGTGRGRKPKTDKE